MTHQEAEQYLEAEKRHKYVHWMHSKHAEVIFAFISFSESVFAPIIIDPFLIALILTKRSRWLRYTIVAIVFSLIGGLFGYLLGFLLVF